MEIPGISANDPSSILRGDNSLSSQQLDRGAFLKLFVAQLENQNPLDPIKNEDFVSQLATFSSLEQLEELNESTVVMIALNQSNALLAQLTQSSGLIGKTVSWMDPDTGVTSSGIVDTVKIQQGLAVLHIDGRDVPLATVTEILGLIEAVDDDSDSTTTEDTEE